MPKYDLEVNPPLMNAAGSLGFAPDLHGSVDLAQFGAFITNPISLSQRSPANLPRLAHFPGGFLLHNGLPNPGLRTALRRYAPRWAHAPLPVLVHIICQQPGEIPLAVEALSEAEGVVGIELGLPVDTDFTSLQEYTRVALQASAGEFPVIIRLPLDRAALLAPILADSDIAALSLAPPRGSLLAANGKLESGRLYGPAIFPQALAAVRAIAVRGIPVIGSGGVYQVEQVEAMLTAGALAVQLDSVLWRGGLSKV